MIATRMEGSESKRWENAHEALKRDRDLIQAKYLQSIAEAERYKQKADALTARLEALTKATRSEECVYCSGTGVMASITTGFGLPEVEEDLSCPVCEGSGYKLKE